ncbi:OLC1v1014126C1 [Oldenlandia corymbosa var. corymbosa]|uniref:OLC1v1014126C1 n=1 Tax=Oldenlandia corymbosa var. corymbosa TaxID=529605 RepID=A0AAV1E2H8_OLDCO|nr:OLC1v1014126C1 [Oldenlandia corymbosa var. corymbosa]
MRRVLSLYSRSLTQSHFLNLNRNGLNLRKISETSSGFPLLPSLRSNVRFFSSSGDDDSSSQNPYPSPNPGPESEGMPAKKEVMADVEDVSNKELKQRLYKYFKEGDEEALPSIFEAILQRSLTGKHELTDDELADDLRIQPLDDVDDEDFENDFEDGHKTDEEIDDLYSARDIVTKKMATDEYFNMTDKKWDEMVKEGMEHGFLKDTRECEAILEDMMNWDKLLPDEIKKKVEAKFDEIAARIDTGELTDEQGYALFKEYEDQMVIECTKLMEAEAPKFDETDVHDKKNNLDDPPGEGPILRWQSRCVFAPGGDAWHPKNRLVKLSVTVKELGLSKYQFRRLRELVGKRYDPGRDQLTITSERQVNLDLYTA